MDIGDYHPSSVDLTEAPQLPSRMPSSTSNSSQIQPPPFSMIMQQAVAMQQFQFQQVLLMQQVMATQQAAARAANIKSAAEMAAARAAEISKQLKGSDAIQGAFTSNTWTTSPNRPKSSSHSRSASRSKSHSPIRYRRDRSVSRSPICYRQDHMSLLDVRDHSGYHIHNRPGYHRGRGDYSWNLYKRDWDRGREREREYYSRSHRTRSRSHSRVKRRCRTQFRSPSNQREFTLSPKHRNDDMRSTCIRRRSKTKDLKESPSNSSRSGNRSPYKKDSSKSQKAQQGLAVKELDDMVDQKRKRSLSSHGVELDDHPNVKTHLLKKDSKQKELSMSLVQSLSLSLSPSKGLYPTLNGVSQSKLEVNNDDHVRARGEASNGVLKISEVQVDSKEQQCSSPILIDECKTFKVSLRLKLPKQDLPNRQSLFKRVECHGQEIDVLTSSKSDDDISVDDWRDNMKAHEHEIFCQRENEEIAQKLEELNPKLKGHGVTQFSYESMTLLQQGYSTLDEFVGLAKGYQEEAKKEALLKKVFSFSPLEDSKKAASLVTNEIECDVENNNKNDPPQIGRGVVGKVVVGKSTIEVLTVEDGEVERKDKEIDEFIFEGPKPPFVARKVTLSQLERDRENVHHVKDKLPNSEIFPNRDVREKQHRHVIEEGHGQKLKGMKFKEYKRQKKDFDERNDRHTKHKWQNRREEDIEVYDDTKDKKHHRKKHKKEEDNIRRDRKKKKHKHRTKFAYDLVGESSFLDAHVSPVLHKKSPCRHKKRKRAILKHGNASPH